MKKILALAAVAGLASVANAQIWTEVPDADGLMPQMTSGTGPLNQIDGFLGNRTDGTADLEDMYCIYIANPALFGATTVGGASFDTQLFLFNAAGFGVTFNDDSTGTQSTLSGVNVPGPGYYNIAISGYDRDAVSAGGQIWSDTPFGTERVADGPGAAGAINGWTGTGATNVPYSIFLRGAEFCVPAPGAAALLGLGGLLAARRRR